MGDNLKANINKVASTNSKGALKGVQSLSKGDSDRPLAAKNTSLVQGVVGVKNVAANTKPGGQSAGTKLVSKKDTRKDSQDSVYDDAEALRMQVMSTFKRKTEEAKGKSEVKVEKEQKCSPDKLAPKTNNALAVRKDSSVDAERGEDSTKGEQRVLKTKAQLQPRPDEMNKEKEEQRVKEDTTKKAGSAGANADSSGGSSSGKKLKDLTSREVDSKLRRLQEMLSQASSNYDSLTESAEAMAKEKRSIQIQLKRKNRRIRALEARVVQEKKMAADMRQQLEKGDEDMKELEKEKARKEVQIGRIKRAVDALKKTQKEKENEANFETCDMDIAEIEEGSIETSVPAYVSPLDLGVKRNVDPYQTFCHFELSGRCNDEACGMQHMNPTTLLLQPPPPPPPPPVKKQTVEAIPLPPEDSIVPATIPLPEQSLVEKSVDSLLSNIRYFGNASERVSPPGSPKRAEHSLVAVAASVSDLPDSVPAPPPPLPPCYSPPPPPPGDSPSSSRPVSPSARKEEVDQPTTDAKAESESFGVDPLSSFLLQPGEDVFDSSRALKQLQRIMNGKADSDSDDDIKIIEVKTPKAVKPIIPKSYMLKKSKKKKKRKH